MARRKGSITHCGYCGTAGHNRATCKYIEDNAKKAKAPKRKKQSKDEPARRRGKQCKYCNTIASRIYDWEISNSIAQDGYYHSGATCPRMLQHQQVDLEHMGAFREQVVSQMVEHGIGVGTLMMAVERDDYNSMQGNVKMITGISYKRLNREYEIKTNYGQHFMKLTAVGRADHYDHTVCFPDVMSNDEPRDYGSTYKVISRISPEAVKAQIPEDFKNCSNIKDLRKYKGRVAKPRKVGDLTIPDYIKEYEQLQWAKTRGKTATY